MTTLTQTRPAVPAAGARSLVLTILREPLRARMWKGLVFLIVVFVLSTAAVPYLFFGLGGGGLLVVTAVGLPVIGLVILGGRAWAAAYRWAVRTLLDTPVTAPLAFAPGRGVISFVKAALTDRAGLRALLFLFAEAAIGMAGGYFALVFIAMTGFTALSPIPWVVFQPQSIDAAGTAHHSLMQFGDYYIETWPRVLGVCAVGLTIFVLVVPWLVRGLCLVHVALVHGLLTPSGRDRRVLELQAGRDAAVEDTAATLRRLERDLHDGTQARLVTVAMALGRAKERLSADDAAHALISDAHGNTKEALAELRELVRGIHPPALDAGLGPALETLAARSAVPVALELGVGVADRVPGGELSPGVAAIAYFSVAELLTNVTRHAAASQAQVSAAIADGRLCVRVSDDGRGGAHTRPGGGLAGLCGRARTVDGEVLLDSPAGGPTTVTVVLPVLDGR